MKEKILKLIDEMIAERENTRVIKPLIRATEITLLKLLKMKIEKLK